MPPCLLACLGSMAAAVQPNSLWNSQKTFYKLFSTSCCPRVYLSTNMFSESTLCVIQAVMKFCFDLNVKFRLPIWWHSSCSISPTANGTWQISWQNITTEWMTHIVAISGFISKNFVGIFLLCGDQFEQSFGFYPSYPTSILAIYLKHKFSAVCLHQMSLRGKFVCTSLRWRLHWFILPLL